LERGFWIYAWKIIGSRDERLCYVGMTGDVTRVAQSPFGRATSTLGTNKEANTLRKALGARGIEPECCKALTLIAYGPLYDAVNAGHYMEHWHKVRALERALYDALKDGGFEPINKQRPHGRAEYDAIYSIRSGRHSQATSRRNTFAAMLPGGHSESSTNGVSCHFAFVSAQGIFGLCGSRLSTKSENLQQPMRASRPAFVGSRTRLVSARRNGAASIGRVGATPLPKLAYNLIRQILNTIPTIY
jgi:hypothetical protein